MNILEEIARELDKGTPWVLYRQDLAAILRKMAAEHGVETNTFAMGLKVVHDGTDHSEPAENCCLCRAPTRWWWGTGARNVALCQSCAKTAKEADLPTKAEWCAKERQLNPRPYGW